MGHNGSARMTSAHHKNATPVRQKPATAIPVHVQTGNGAVPNSIVIRDVRPMNAAICPSKKILNARMVVYQPLLSAYVTRQGCVLGRPVNAMIQNVDPTISSKMTAIPATAKMVCGDVPSSRARSPNASMDKPKREIATNAPVSMVYGDAPRDFARPPNARTVRSKRETATPADV